MSRTAILKWESGRGYPGIESLKAISEFFPVSIDELLSGKEQIRVAEDDSIRKLQHIRTLVFGLPDCGHLMFIFIPFFGQRDGDFIRQVSLLSLSQDPGFIKAAYLIFVLLTIALGTVTFALQNCNNVTWIKSRNFISLLLGASGVIMFMENKAVQLHSPVT